MATITISREFGSHGDTVAQLLAERLDYRYFDKNLMTGLAVQSGLSLKQALNLPDEQKHARSLVERLFGNFAPAGGDPQTWAALSEAETRARQTASMITQLIEAAYAQGNVVIVGRGGQAVLCGKPNVIHVRLIAPLELRIQRHQRRAGISPAEARRQILQRDQASIDYVKNYYNLDSTDISLYDLVINTARLTPSAAASLVVEAMTYLPVQSS